MDWWSNQSSVSCQSCFLFNNEIGFLIFFFGFLIDFSPVMTVEARPVFENKAHHFVSFVKFIVCRPFIFTFSSRRNYLYCTAFGRDRALMHLVNQTDGGQGDGESGRLTPRLERRKVSVRRDDLLRQAEQTLHHLGCSRLVTINDSDTYCIFCVLTFIQRRKYFLFQCNAWGWFRRRSGYWFWTNIGVLFHCVTRDTKIITTSLAWSYLSCCSWW